jgi:hypothetical protein
MSLDVGCAHVAGGMGSRAEDGWRRTVHSCSLQGRQVMNSGHGSHGHERLRQHDGEGHGGLIPPPGPRASHQERMGWRSQRDTMTKSELSSHIDGIAIACGHKDQDNRRPRGGCGQSIPALNGSGCSTGSSAHSKERRQRGVVGSRSLPLGRVPVESGECRSRRSSSGHVDEAQQDADAPVKTIRTFNRQKQRIVRVGRVFLVGLSRVAKIFSA